jgi:hypothetical protein
MSVNYKRKHQWKISKHWKRGKETLTGSPTLIYTTSCREVKGREIIRERDPERKISSIQTGGDIPTGGVILFPMMTKEKRKNKGMKIERKNRCMKTGGETPRRETLFH